MPQCVHLDPSKSGGFPDGASGKEPTCQCRRLAFDPWIGKIPWRKKWQPTPPFLPGNFHGQKNLAGYSPQGLKELDMTEHNLDLEKAEESEIKLPTSCWIFKKAREFQKNFAGFYFCFIDYAKACDCVDHYKLWKILKEMGIPDPLTCLLRNLYAGQEATVKTGHGTTHWFQIGKGVCKGCILSPCLFSL